MSDSPENERLLKSIKTLARTRSERSRKAMYMALLRSQLYVPVDGGDGGGVERFLQDQPLQGQPVYVVFTSLEALALWRPDHAEVVKMDGMSLFPALRDSQAASVLINPKGQLGGELYRNEISVLADAVPQLRAWLDR